MQNLIEELHNSPAQFELVVTGGGSSVIGQLLAVPGASATLLSACVPYHQQALDNYLGTPPKSACSEEAARAMASKAFLNARQIAPKSAGVAATAALQTNRSRRGTDKIHVSIQSLESLSTYYLELETQQTRAEQETACADFILKCIAQFFHIGELKDLPVPTHQAQVSKEWQDLYLGDAKTISSEGFGALFPGAFNPPHQGHLKIRDIAQHRLGCNVAFELSILNVDKPPLDYIEMARRAELLNNQPVVFSRTATFLEKSEVFDNAHFIVGVDTLVRIDDKKYYGDSQATCQAAIKTMAERGTQFLVFGREDSGTFIGLDDVTISAELRALCTGVTEEEFREDVSSTHLRNSS